MSEHDRYAEWDGAYVLGALAPAERQEYELHLADCAACQRAVGSLASLPGLLGRVDPTDLDAVESAPPADLERRLLAAARPSRWRRTSTRVAAGLAVAAVVAAAIVVPVALGHRAHRPAGEVQVALSRPAGAPLTAQVGLVPKGWGTEVEVTCHYPAGGYGANRSYALYAVDAGGTATLVSSWHAASAPSVHMTGSTTLAVGDIRRLEVRDVATGSVLLSADRH